MNETVAGLVGVVIGGLLSIVASLAVTQLEAARERRALALTKLEELHSQLSKMLVMYGSEWANLSSRVITGECLKDSGLAMDPYRVELLMSFYFYSELREQLEAIQDSRTAFGRVILRAITDRPFEKSLPERKQFLLEADPIHSNLQKAIADAMAACSRLARSHVDDWTS